MLLLGLLVGTFVQAAPSGAEEGYLADVKPMLAHRCMACHGSLKQEGGLRLDTVDFMKKGGDSGPVIVPGKALESLIVERVSSADPSIRMPPEGSGTPLNTSELGALSKWIASGGVGPTDEKPEEDPHAHWAFQEPTRPALSLPVDSTAWSRVDALLSARRQSLSLPLQPEASPSIWLRRVTLDLTGLPPSPQERAEYLADSSSDADERVVDRLLASPAHGERWGRHWMDVWRYSDWWGLGAELRYSQPHIWHWRDWIVESLNEDVGYDEMVRQMLAGDELYPNDLTKLRATGYLGRSYFLFNRNTWLDEVVEHASKSFLGLTTNCAKCHDHKYDPISQVDYYRLRAFFEPYQLRVDALPGEVNLERDGVPRAFDCNLSTSTFVFVRGDEKNPKREEPIGPGLPELLTLAVKLPAIEEIPLPLEAVQPGLRPHVLQDQINAVERDICVAQAKRTEASKRLEEIRSAATHDPSSPDFLKAEQSLAVAEMECRWLDGERASLEARASADRAQAEGSAEAHNLATTAASRERSQDLARAEWECASAEHDARWCSEKEKDAAEERVKAAREKRDQSKLKTSSTDSTYTPILGSRKTRESNIEDEASRSKPYPKVSSGRRRALAAWMTDERNPLTARVAVNHLWMRHFGSPLVPTVFDFGRKGTPPIHQDVLDDLAIDFVEHGWEMRRVHRALVTSRLYRTTSSGLGMSDEAIQRDPDNQYYTRMNPLRMEAQAVRDALLFLSEDLARPLGGEPVAASEQASSRRRSLYFFHSHNDQNLFLTTFDDADVLQCYRRSESVVPQQALALSNGKLAMECAERISDLMPRESDELFIATAFEHLLGSPPTAEEQAICLESLAQFERIHSSQKVEDSKRMARVDLVMTLINHNDFVTVR